MLATEPDWQLPRHIELIDSLLLKVAAGELRRLIITVPVRHGKSELCSRFFPAWMLGMRPDYRVVVAGYGSEFAREWGDKARSLVREFGPQFFGVGLQSGSRAKSGWKVEYTQEHFETGHRDGGSMYALGVGAPLTGRGANVLVIDDPIKNHEEANSEVMRKKVWDWYWSTARTRLEPKGAVVILMARWHEDDLVGRLLNHPVDVEPWTTVNLPALAEDDDPLGRDPGEALWPERYDQAELESVRRSQLTLNWNALYQQRPAPAEGFLFKRKDFRYWRTETTQMGAMETVWYLLPRDDDTISRVDAGHVTVFQVSDVAMSEKETADYTVASTWAATQNGDLILLDVQRRRFEEQQTITFLAGVADEHHCPGMWVERFGAGRNPLARLAELGYPVREIPVEAGTQADKVTRAFGAIALFERHKVFLPGDRPEWLGAYENELAGFNTAMNDDQVDVTSYAARLLPQLGVGRTKPQQLGAGPKPHTAGVMSQQF